MLANLLIIIDFVDIVDNRDCSVCKAIAAFLPADDPCVVGDDQHTPRCVWAVVLVLWVDCRAGDDGPRSIYQQY